MNKRCVGSKYEEMAMKYLNENGVKIIERNFRCHIGEVDLIGSKDNYYIFFEVKYRKNERAGYPVEAVNIKKQQTISKVADYFKVVRKLPDSCNVRFDVVTILGDNVKWYQNAFDYCGYR